MIRLDIAEYCHDCDKFDPEIAEQDKLYNNQQCVLNNTNVVCKNKYLCQKLYSYLYNHYQKSQ